MTTTDPPIEALDDHPAKFAHRVLDVILRSLDDHIDPEALPDRCARILDPFAGVGRVHSLMDDRAWIATDGIELEPEWAACHERTQIGTALALPFEPDTFDALITSPCYGNRMSDHHEARDDSTRHTYRHTLRRPLSAGSAAGLQWGPGYRRFHHAAWSEARRVLRPDALVIINISNHIRGGTEQLVTEWHMQEWLGAGARLVDVHRVETPRQGHGANRDLRVDCEFVLVMRAPETGPLGL